MKLYKVTVITDGPPPEYGATFVSYVLAHDEEEAKRIGYNPQPDDVATAKEIPMDKPLRITGDWL